jgi:predicted nucleic acid-binding protein
VTVFPDANIVIYFVERHPVWGAKATARIATARSSGDDFAVSDLIRMECQVGPLSSGDRGLLADYARFFSRPEVRVLPITAAVCDRAAAIRAKYRFKPLDALHLAAAVDAGCGKFVTHDTGLRSFPDTNVEILT